MSSNAHQDLYVVRGVANDASAIEIKGAYRRLALEHHPDRTGGDKIAEEKFKAITAAYEVVGDAERRPLYDEFGAVSLLKGFDTEMARRSEAVAAANPELDGSYNGLDFHADLVVTTSEGWRGTTRRVEYLRWHQCAACNGIGQVQMYCHWCAGTGMRQFRNVQTCFSCGGSGVVTNRLWQFYACSMCGGAGQLDYGLVSAACAGCGGVGPLATACDTCNGQGVAPQGVSLTVEGSPRTRDRRDLCLPGHAATPTRGQGCD